MAFSIVLIWGTPSLNTFVQIVLYSISLWFLTRPKALEYFRGMGSQELEEEVGADDKAEGVDEADSDYRP